MSSILLAMLPLPGVIEDQMRLGGFGGEKVRNGCGWNLSLWLVVGYCTHTVSIARDLVDLLDVVGKYV